MSEIKDIFWNSILILFKLLACFTIINSLIKKSRQLITPIMPRKIDLLVSRSIYQLDFIGFHISNIYQL